MGEIIKSCKTLVQDYLKSAVDPRTANSQIFSSIVAQEPTLAASLEALITQLPFSVRDHEFMLWYGDGTSQASTKKAEIETAASSLSKSHSTKPSKSKPKATSSPPLNGKTSMTLTSTVTSIPIAVGVALLNHNASNSTIFAPIVISTTSVIRSNPANTSSSATQNAIVASSTLTPSSTPNMGMAQPTHVLKAAGALAVGVAGMMILL